MNKQELETGINFRLFAGCLMTSELRMQLNQSSLWKQAKIAPSLQDLIETHFQEKDFIGLFLQSDKIQLEELRQIEKKISQVLKTYCPQFPSEKIKILVFSQVFIS